MITFDVNTINVGILDRMPKIMKTIIREIRLETTVAYKERAAYNTGQLRASVKTKTAGGMVTVGATVEYAERANIIAHEKSGNIVKKFSTVQKPLRGKIIHHQPGPHFVERTEAYMEENVKEIIESVIEMEMET